MDKAQACVFAPQYMAEVKETEKMNWVIDYDEHEEHKEITAIDKWKDAKILFLVC